MRSATSCFTNHEPSGSTTNIYRTIGDSVPVPLGFYALSKKHAIKTRRCRYIWTSPMSLVRCGAQGASATLRLVLRSEALLRRVKSLATKHEPAEPYPPQRLNQFNNSKDLTKGVPYLNGKFSAEQGWDCLHYFLKGQAYFSQVLLPWTSAFVLSACPLTVCRPDLTLST